MNEEGKEFLTFKIIQSEEVIKVQLTPNNLSRDFHDIFQSLLKELKLKQKDIFLTNEEGKMIGIHDLSFSLKEITHRFGTILKVYSEKIM